MVQQMQYDPNFTKPWFSVTVFLFDILLPSATSLHNKPRQILSPIDAFSTEEAGNYRTLVPTNITLSSDLCTEQIFIAKDAAESAAAASLFGAAKVAQEGWVSGPVWHMVVPEDVSRA